VVYIPDTAARILRTLLQLLAGGAFTALFDQIVTDVPVHVAPYLALIFTLLVTVAQNSIEGATGKALLKPAGAEHDRVRV
jgi:hypothetical protein